MFSFSYYFGLSELKYKRIYLSSDDLSCLVITQNKSDLIC